MRYILSFILVVFISRSLSAQVGIGTTTPDASAMLQIDNTTKGVLVPRMTQVQRTAIVAPVTGLLVFQTDGAAGFYYYNGASWATFGGGAAWDILGNSGTTSASNMLGTADVQDLSLITNSNEAIRITSNGEVGIGTNTPSAMLDIENTTAAISFSDGFEDSTLAPFTTGGDANWLITTTAGEFNTGSVGVKSGDIADDETSWIEYSATVPAGGGTLSFYYKTDTESCCDELHFYIDGVDQTGGGLTNATWTNQTYPLTTGVHVLRWAHEKDWSSSTGADEVYIDDIIISSPVPALRIQDGNEANGYVMLSDASGNGTWTDTATIATADDDWAFAAAGTTNTDPVYRIGDVSMANGSAPFANLDIEENTGAGEFTEIGVGSDEYFYDRLSETSISHSAVPTVHNSVSCGSATLRWNTVYATNTAISTSDRREKIAINTLSYGLNSLLKLRPVSYIWKNEVYGKTVLADSEKKTKVGFIAQEVQEVIPEIVVANEWRQKSTKEPGVYVKKEAKRLGVRYSEVLPVLVKATQEHQLLLNKLTKQQEEISLLLKELK